MLARTPRTASYLATPPAPKLSRLKFLELRDEVADCVRTGEPTPFAYEASCRHGLRSSLVLRGWKWARADFIANEIVVDALRIIGAKRPSWYEGQPEFTRTVQERLRCANKKCGKPIERESDQVMLYCSEPCRQRTKSERQAVDRRKEQAAASRAWRAAARAAGPLRLCELCSAPFNALDITGKKPQRFCSRTCRSRFASQCAKAWRRE
jgi:hypothetical protein